MKLKLLLVFVLCLFISNNSFSQTCGTPAVQGPISNLKPIINSSFLNPNTPICINIQYHIVRRDNGANGYNSNDLNQITDQLSQTLNPHNLYVNELGFDYIDNTTYSTVNNVAEFNQLVQINNNPNAINIYLVYAAVGWIGRANGILSNEYVIRNQDAASFITSHEFGHCIDLWHTFQGTAAGTTGCAELIDGSNCESCGDYVCDTPADTNTGNSGGYMPDLTNLMSYYYFSDHFTDGQIERSRLAFATSPVLQQTVATGCASPEIIGDDYVCDNNTYTITNNESDVTLWETSSNINIISSTINSITVSQVINSSSSGWIDAHVDGIVVRKEIFVGKPSVTTHGIFGGHDNVAVNTTSQLSVQWATGNSHYYWTVTPNTSCSAGGGPTIQPTNSNTYNSTSRYGHINWGSCTGTFAVACFAKNDCGNTWIGTKWVTVYDPYDNNDDPCEQGPTKIEIYPNPVTKGESININKLAPGNPCDDDPYGGGRIALTTINTIEVFNLQGRIVYKTTSYSDKFLINDLRLKKGIYILNFTSSDGFNVKKRILIK